MQLRTALTSALLLRAASLLHAAKWSYSGLDGEQHWSRLFPFCGGVFQSPIHISSDLLRFDPTLPPVQLHNYHLPPTQQLTLGNNGHSGDIKTDVLLTWRSSGSTLSSSRVTELLTVSLRETPRHPAEETHFGLLYQRSRPFGHYTELMTRVQISLPSRMYISSLPHRYTAAQLHFHWGSAARPLGSEHMVNNKQYAGEMHVVHFNSEKYPNMSVAVDKSDGLAVLGVFIEIGDFSPAFDQFLKFLNGVKYRGQKVQVPGFNVRNLFPSRLDEYYRYDGSLTTPPCYPSVLWTLFRNPVTISRSQFVSLATALFSSHLQDSTPEPLNGNFRRPQEANSRVVLASFKEENPFWTQPGLYVPVLVGSALGLALVVLFACLVKRKRSHAKMTKKKSLDYISGQRAQSDSTV